MAHFIAAKALFGYVDVRFRIENVPMETGQAACSIAKIIRLIGPLSRGEDVQYKEEFDLAELVAQLDALPTRSLEEELKKFDVDQECIEFIRWLLTIGPEKRPTAHQALNHPWLQGVI